jgi:hypothetical protein
MFANKLMIVFVLSAFILMPVWAQGTDPMASEAIKQALASKPRHVQAVIVGMEPATRTLTLKGTNGNIIPVVVRKEATNFESLKVGDRVDVLMKRAMLVQAIKASDKDSGLRKRVDTDVYAPASDGSGYGSVHQMEILATIQRIDRKNKTITLRGPWKTETLALTPEVAADNIKAGDTIRAIFISAMAIEVTPKPH